MTTVDVSGGAGTTPGVPGSGEQSPEQPETPEASDARVAAMTGKAPRILLAALVVGLLTLIGALLFGHGVETKPAGGLPWAGAGTAWALPIARFLHDAAAVVTVGFLLLAVALLPDRKGKLGPAARAAHRIARVAAAFWLVAVVLEGLISLSQEAAVPLGQVLSGSQISFYAFHVIDGQTGFAVAVIALLILLTPGISSVNSVAVLLGLAMLGLVLPALLTGHSASAGNHDLAISSLSLHVLAASVWVGGLIAVCWLACRKQSKSLAVALPRFSTLALVCFVTVGLSGVLNAYVRVGSISELFTTRYGGLVLFKTAALVALGLIGYRHRKTTLPAAARGDRRAFVRLAAAELVVMAIAIGLAVALSKSPPPVATSAPDTSAAKAALGYNLPGPISIKALAFDWAPQLLFLVFIAVAAVYYARGVHRLHARGDSWPRIYTFCWYAGLAVIFITTQTGVSRYGAVLFSVHMAQHMLLSMVAPPLLALGAPITLALRYLPSKSSIPGARNARDWLLAALRTPVVRVFSNPLVAIALFVFSTFGLYFSGLFGDLMENHAGHIAMEIHFLLIGCLVFWPLVSPDPLPHRPAHGARMFLLVILVPFHAFFGLALITDTHVIAANWYHQLGRTWGSSLLSDQHTGGGIAMALAEPVAFLVAGVILMQWSRADARKARAFDRKSDRDPEHDELAAYNRMLSDLAKRG